MHSHKQTMTFHRKRIFSTLIQRIVRAQKWHLENCRDPRWFHVPLNPQQTRGANKLAAAEIATPILSPQSRWPPGYSVRRLHSNTLQLDGCGYELHNCEGKPGDHIIGMLGICSPESWQALDK